MESNDDNDSVDINREKRVGHRNSRFTSMRITIALVLQLWASLEILQDQSIRPSTHCAGDCTLDNRGASRKRDWRLLVGERLATGAGAGRGGVSCDGWRRENTAGLKMLAVRNASAVGRAVER